MPLTKQQQRALPANRARVTVRAMDGAQLASTTPQRARRMVKAGAARFEFDPATGVRILQMLLPCGTQVPPRIASPGDVLPMRP